jgi:hypothetical protein
MPLRKVSTMVRSIANSLPRNSQGVSYNRLRDLPRLLRLWPGDVIALGDADRAGLVERLRQMLRNERKQGLARHWSYDLSRHAALLRAYRAELLELEAYEMQKASRGGRL